MTDKKDEQKSPPRTYVDYLREHRLGQDVHVHMKLPMQTPEGGLSFPSVAGILLGAYKDGVAIRGPKGEVFFRWEETAHLTLPSKIATAPAGGELPPHPLSGR